MSVKQLYIFSKAPYADKQGMETLDAVLLAASFENEVSLLFIDDGVFQLLNNQRPSQYGVKPYTKTFTALEDFEISQVFVDKTSLLGRGVDIADLAISARETDASAISDLIAQQDQVFHF